MHDPNLHDDYFAPRHCSVHEYLVSYLPSRLDIITCRFQRGAGAEGRRPRGGERVALRRSRRRTTWGVAVTEESASAAARIGHEQEAEEGKEQLAMAFN
jgi:hypothetical protein